MGFFIVKTLCGKGDKKMKKIITSESVNVGHPDKTCDVIADCFLDAALAQDANSQMAVECAIKNNKLFIYHSWGFYILLKSSKSLDFAKYPRFLKGIGNNLHL